MYHAVSKSSEDVILFGCGLAEHAHDSLYCVLPYCWHREVPRVLMIYDLMNISRADAKKAIRDHFYHNKDVKDQRVQDMLVEKGYIDLEDTLLQHKQKTHLMVLLEGPIGTDFNDKRLGANASEEEQFHRWVQ